MMSQKRFGRRTGSKQNVMRSRDIRACLIVSKRHSMRSLFRLQIMRALFDRTIMAEEEIGTKCMRPDRAQSRQRFGIT